MSAPAKKHRLMPHLWLMALVGVLLGLLAAFGLTRWQNQYGGPCYEPKGFKDFA
jgi:hypothetical protein